MPQWHLIDDLRSAINRGLTSIEIEQELGIEHHSILKALKRQHPVEHKIMLWLRGREWDQRRWTVMTPESQERIRCEHGAWSSTGECQHGKIQGKKAA